MVKKFLAKVRADMVWVISCRLGLKIKASRGIRKRLKVGRKLRLISVCGPSLRPRHLEADIRVRTSSDVDGISGSASCHGEASSEKAQEAIMGVCLDVSGDTMVLGPEAGSVAVVSTSPTDPVAAISTSPTGKIAIRHLSP
jgi:hypothetical protein